MFNSVWWHNVRPIVDRFSSIVVIFYTIVSRSTLCCATLARSLGKTGGGKWKKTVYFLFPSSETAGRKMGRQIGNAILCTARQFFLQKELMHMCDVLCKCHVDLSFDGGGGMLSR